jgi:hypothetical protein
MADKFKLFDTIEHQDDFEDLLTSISDIISLFSKTKSQLCTKLPKSSLDELLVKLSRYIIHKTCEYIISLKDIAVDACTPIDMILNKEGFDNFDLKDTLKRVSDEQYCFLS